MGLRQCPWAPPESDPAASRELQVISISHFYVTISTNQGEILFFGFSSKTLPSFVKNKEGFPETL